MKPTLLSTLRVGLGAAFLLAAPAGAALYQQNFEVDDTANWTLNNGPSDAAANYFFDYSTVGIPAAPGGSGTRGMKLQANLNNGVFGGMSVSPTGQALPARYILSFNWWSNTVGPFPAGGSGSTNLSTFGVGTAGTSAQWPGNADSVYFGATGDGGSAADIRAYSSAALTSYPDGSPVYSALGSTNRNNSNAYYSSFGGVEPPAAQTGLFAGQNGAVAAGAMAFAWHTVVITLDTDLVTWDVDGLRLATLDASTVTLGGTNILFGHSDINAGSSADVNRAALLFTLIDNVKVDAIPEPSSFTLAGLVSFGLLNRRRRA